MTDLDGPDEVEIELTGREADYVAHILPALDEILGEEGFDDEDDEEEYDEEEDDSDVDFDADEDEESDDDDAEFELPDGAILVLPRMTDDQLGQFLTLVEAGDQEGFDDGAELAKSAAAKIRAAFAKS